jgi:hypothetical protein
MDFNNLKILKYHNVVSAIKRELLDTRMVPTKILLHGLQ